MEFTKSKQYSLLKWFQLFPMAVNRSCLVEGAFPCTILKNFHYKFSTEFWSQLFPGHTIDFMSFLKKSSNPLCSVTSRIIILKNDSSSPNQFSKEEKRKLSRILMYTYALIVWGNDYHHPSSFKWYTTISVRVFRLLSLSLLFFPQCFGHCILQPSSGVPCLSGHRNDSTWEIIFKVWLLKKNDFPGWILSMPR